MSTTNPASTPENDYKDDLSTHSDADSDFENDPVIRNARSSVEVAEHDQELLEEEEEREKLLTAGKSDEAPRGFFGRRRKNGHPHPLGEEKIRRKSGRSRRKKRADHRSSHDEEGELMYEMEEGGPKGDISSQASSSSLELDKLTFTHSSISKRRKTAHWILVTALIVILFAVLTFGAYKVSHSRRPEIEPSVLSNGSSTFAPTTILISLDGFRADFLQRGITPTLNQFVAEGVSPRYMLPSFPSVTFPNHYTLVTGLYPECHGVVGNSFWDPKMQKEFYYTDPARSMQPEWWAGGEPIWVTAEKQNVRTGIHMWPGSEAGMEIEATFLDKFNGTEELSRKTDRILQLLDLPKNAQNSGRGPRPQLIAAYVPNVDANGHKYGPNTTEVWETISHVDVMLHNLFMGLEERNLTKLINVIIVSDHGMATTSTDRLVQLDDLIDLDLVEHIDGWPLYGLRPKDPIDLQGLYDRLLVESKASGNFEVYLRDENMPERYHFSRNDRIAPLWVVPKTGWAIVHKEDFDVNEAKARGELYHPKGLHGYDHENPLMRAIFIARGPAFPHKPNSRLDVFQNIEVYNIVCDSLGIMPRPNNGTLRLPLKPVGLHSDKPSAEDDSAIDFPPEAGTSEVSDSLDTTDSTPDTNDGAETDEEVKDFWAYMKAKIKAAQEWANKVIEAWKSNQKDSNEQGKSFDQGIDS